MSEKRINAGLLLKGAVRRFPHDVAVAHRERCITYSELDEAANRLSNALRDLGLETGDRVAVLLRNSIEFLTVRYAVMQAGLAFVGLNPRESLQGCRYIVRHSGAKAMIMDSTFVAEWKRSGIGCDVHGREIAVPSTHVCEVLSYDQLLAGASPEAPNVLVGADDVVKIAYTSGTTGRPKGVVVTFGQALNRIRNYFLNQDVIIDDTDVLLSVAPLTHAAWHFVEAYTVRGATNVILEEFDVSEVLETIQQEGVTAVFMVPTMIIRIVNHPEVHEYDLRSLRRIYYGSAPMPLKALQKAIDVFGHSVFRQHYGLTEHNSPVTLLFPSDHAVDGDERKMKRLSSIGRVAIGVEVKLADDAGREVGPNEPGEILIRSDAGMKEYWNDPEETTNTIIEGWIRTGDVGAKDDDGYIYLIDRKAGLIISGGYNVYPREVEQVIMSHPDVLEVCVFGVSDGQWGESVKAVVVVKQAAEVSEEEIIDLCRYHLANYKKPTSVEFVDKLPRSGRSGKVLKSLLRKPVGDLERVGSKRRDRGNHGV